jgi:phosphate:Na+ symporter
MTAMLFQLLGGIGLFLLGMTLLTDGLKTFAGDALRRALLRFTGTPMKAFFSGALATVMVQSSSATTVAVIGFVSAGLITFPQAVGIVFGASLGTTGTGWIVSVLGLNVSIGYYALPLVGVGAFMRLLAQGPKRSLGLALAGFGLIFIGISVLQEGMQNLSGIFRLADLPTTGLIGHVVVMVVGIMMTVVMQSSSAAVATTLTALHSQAITFEQAASLVIGAAVGTTVTGALAAIGATVPAQRTALAHVTFNLATGLIAVLLLPVLLWLIVLAQEHLGLDPGAVSLAAFHTTFIALGVVLFLPFADRFAHWVERRLPDKGPQLTRHLDDSLLTVPPIALEASRRALRDIATEMFSAMRINLDRPETGITEVTRARITQALDDAQRFFSRIPAEGEHAAWSEERVAQMHAIDHLLRLTSRLAVPSGVRRMLASEHQQEAVRRCADMLRVAADGLAAATDGDWLAEVERHAGALAEMRQNERPVVMGQTAGGGVAPAAALEVLDAMRWMDRVAHHVWRCCAYLGRDPMRGEPGPEAAEPVDSTTRISPGSS